MGRRRLTSELFVSMNGQSVGILTRRPNGMLEFSYGKNWLDSEHRRPISLSLPLGEQIFAGDQVDNFFDNLLPDSQPIRNRIQTKFGVSSNRNFDLLWHIGRDCVGALQLTPEDQSADVHKIEARAVNEEEIADTLKNYRTMPLGMKKGEDFRISITGAQEKTALLWYQDAWHLPSGATPTSHIFKLPIGHIEHSGIDLSDSVENEWLCLQILKTYGIPVADARIQTFNGVKTLIVERFDRRWATDRSWLMRLPQEDICQALNVPSALKYESDGGPGIPQIMNLLLGATGALAARRLFMIANLLFWLLAAIDGHAKNFSIFLLPGGGFQLTPLYDVISGYPLVAQKQLEQRRLKMAMALTGKNRHYDWNAMLHRHWLSTAKNCHFPTYEMGEIIDETLDQLDMVMNQVGDLLPDTFPDAVAAPVFDGMRNAREKLIRSA